MTGRRTPRRGRFPGSWYLLLAQPRRLVPLVAAGTEKLDQLDAASGHAQSCQPGGAQVDELAIALEAQLACGLRLAGFARLELAPQCLEVHAALHSRRMPAV